MTLWQRFWRDLIYWNRRNTAKRIRRGGKGRIVRAGASGNVKTRNG